MKEKIETEHFAFENNNNPSLSEAIFEGAVLEFHPEPAVIFHNEAGGEILKLEANGDIFVKGKLIENDKEIVNALREFLKLS